MTPGARPAPDQGQGFPKRVRLLRRPEYLVVQNGGQKLQGELALVLFLRNTLGHTRVGFTVSTKVGNVVVRNRIRRRFRQLFRTRRERLPGGLDVVLIARTRAATAGFADFVRAFDWLERELRRRF